VGTIAGLRRSLEGGSICQKIWKTQWANVKEEEIGQKTTQKKTLN